LGKRRLPRSQFLNSRFGAALQEFGIALKKSSAINHPVSKGSSREESLRAFFRERLPTSYAVAEGEVVDLNGRVSPQLDLVFYDQSRNFALIANKIQVLPAEALLASIEVKSVLTKSEIEKSARAVRKLPELQPFGQPLGGTDIGDGPSAARTARYFHCVFAYDTDLSLGNWLNWEAARFSSFCEDEHLFDSAYVLNRGVINLPGNVAKLEDENGGAITNFYFSILTFLLREEGRRPNTPYDRYVTHETKDWQKIGGQKTQR
jgi:hypothetical protein